MRRLSDIRSGSRTGCGRRARDRLLSGEPVAAPALDPRNSELDNLLLFVADDLREPALAVGGIEAFLVEVEDLLGRSDLGTEHLSELLGAHDVEHRVAEMDDALASLLRSLRRVRAQLG